MLAPLCTRKRCAGIAQKVGVAREHLASVQERLAKATTGSANGAELGTQTVGILSIKDVLMTIAKHHIDPVLQWHEEETRIQEIEERAGYSE